MVDHPPQQLARTLLVRYREELVRLYDQEVALGLAPVIPNITTHAAIQAERDDIVNTLILVLERLPLHVAGEAAALSATDTHVAVNTYWLVSKIRFVASSLLDSPASEENPSSSDRILTQLCECVWRIELIFFTQGVSLVSSTTSSVSIPRQLLCIKSIFEYHSPKHKIVLCSSF